MQSYRPSSSCREGQIWIPKNSITNLQPFSSLSSVDGASSVWGRFPLHHHRILLLPLEALNNKHEGFVKSHSCLWSLRLLCHQLFPFTMVQTSAALDTPVTRLRSLQRPCIYASSGTQVTAELPHPPVSGSCPGGVTATVRRDSGRDLCVSEWIHWVLSHVQLAKGWERWVWVIQLNGYFWTGQQHEAGTGQPGGHLHMREGQDTLSFKADDAR